ncbi:hypothetical protein KSP40_PGU010888 [Platanthera guangdongensis]|uniref:Uncharacterized protein n=1 Tax=Platanthera guangdongensis TaxID=2320717 RepID=A0ABR2MFF3_9ASPA
MIGQEASRRLPITNTENFWVWVSDPKNGPGLNIAEQLGSISHEIPSHFEIQTKRAPLPLKPSLGMCHKSRVRKTPRLAGERITRTVSPLLSCFSVKRLLRTYRRREGKCVVPCSEYRGKPCVARKKIPSVTGRSTEALFGHGRKVRP